MKQDLTPKIYSSRRGLGRRQPGDRHPERRAGYVVEADLVAELDRDGLAAVLAADAELDAGPGLSPALDRRAS